MTTNAGLGNLTSNNKYGDVPKYLDFYNQERDANVRLLFHGVRLERNMAGNGTTGKSIAIAATSSTLAATDLFSNFFITYTGSSGNATVTLPTAAQLVACLPNCDVGDLTQAIQIKNSLTTNTLTVAPGTNGTNSTLGAGAATAIANGSTGTYRIEFTNVTAGAEAYLLHRTQ